MIFLSIIVPFYNVEHFIEQCIRSLFDQDVPTDQYEVICVDDCSPDNSVSIIRHLQQEFPTLQLINHKKNKRQGAARNTGLRAAKGQYIWFVDSDDYILPNVLGKLFKVLKERYIEVLQFGCYIDYKNHVCKQFPLKYTDNTIYSGELFMLDESKQKWDDRCVEAWKKIIKRDFLIKNNLFFAENVMYEDTDWSFNLFIEAEYVMHTEIEPYVYRYNTSSVTHTGRNPILLKYEILQLARCAELVNKARTQEIQHLIANYIKVQSSIIKNKICNLSFHNKLLYVKYTEWRSLSILRKYISTRTYLTIKYGISL